MPDDRAPGRNGDGRPRRWDAVVPTRSPTAATVLAIVVYVALAVVVFWHLWTNNPTQVSQPGGDQFSNMWFLEWVPFAISHGYNPFFSNFVNYPFGVNLLTNTSALLLGLAASPITVVWGPVASFNVLLTLALPASATSGYFLARRFTTWRPAAFVAGLLYGFSPYEIAQSAGHLNLTFVVFPPLVLLALHELVVRQARPARRWGIGLGLLLTAQFFVSSEVLASTIVVAAICLVTTVAVGWRSARPHLRHALVGGAWAAGTAVVLLSYPLWFALRGPGHISGPIQLVPQGYRADLLGPIIPDSLMRLAPAHLAHIADNFANSPTENGSYLGVTLLALLAIATVALWRQSKPLRVIAVGGAAAFVLSLGAGLVVKSNPPGAASGFPLPERIFTKLPVLSNTIPVRYSLYVALFAALELALVLDHLHRRLASDAPARGGHRPPRWWAPTIPAVLTVVALVPLVPVAPFTAVGPVGTPSFFTTAALRSSVPVGSTTVLYPYPSSKTPNGQAWQAISDLRFRMPGGYFLVPQGRSQHIAFSPALGYTRTTLTATVLTDLAAGTPPARSTALRTSLRAQWRTWHVQTLVAFPTLGANPTGTIAFFTWLTGRPPIVQPGATYLWTHLEPSL